MKKLSLLFTLFSLLCLLGCDSKIPVMETTPAQTESPTEPDARIATAPALAEGPDGSLVLLITDYFSLTLPHDWANTCVYTVTDPNDPPYTVSIYEDTSYWDFGGGKLCSIMLLPTDADYTEFPAYEYLGILDTPDGSFQLVVLFPTDVQFSQDTAEVYQKMERQLPDVLSTLNPTGKTERIHP